METYGGSGGTASPILTSILDGEWSVSFPGRITPGEGAPCKRWVGGWVGPGAGMHVAIPTADAVPLEILKLGAQLVTQ
jgi:hypothetical protein